MAIRKREPQHDGAYWGIKDGKVVAVQKWLESSVVYLTSMDEDAVEFRHHVMRGRDASSEVIVVFGQSDITFVHASDCDSDTERAVREKLKALASEKGGAA